MIRKPIKKTKIATGATIKGAFIRRRDAFGSNLEIHCNTPKIAREKYLALKIAHLLFPQNFPNPRGVVRDVVHTRYVAPHKELRNAHREFLKSLEQKPHSFKEAKLATLEVFERHRANIERMVSQFRLIGIWPDAHMMNIGFRKNRIIFYDTSVWPETIRVNLDKLKISEQKKLVIMRLLKQYEGVEKS